MSLSSGSYEMNKYLHLTSNKGCDDPHILKYQLISERDPLEISVTM